MILKRISSQFSTSAETFVSNISRPGFIIVYVIV